MNESKKKSFHRAKSFEIRLKYDKQANSNNQKLLSTQKKKTKNSESTNLDKGPHYEVKNPKHSNHINGILFGRRERWQKIKCISEYKELDELPTKKRIQPTYLTKWENLHERSEKDQKRPYVKTSVQKRKENSLSARTIYPEYDSSFSRQNTKKLDFPSRLKYKATGSLCNLIDCTSNETPRKIKNRRQDLKSIIFDPEFNIYIPPKRHKSYVNLDNYKTDTSFAGVKTGERKGDFDFNKPPHNNFSTQKKFLNLISNIFSQDPPQRNRNPYTSRSPISQSLNNSIAIDNVPATDRSRQQNKESFSIKIDVIDNTKRKVGVTSLKKPVQNGLNPMNDYSSKLSSKAISRRGSDR